MKISVKIDLSRMSAVVSQMSEEALERAGDRAVQRYRDNITATGRVDTAYMRGTVHARGPVRVGSRTVLTIGTQAKYAHYQEWGTRAHGPVRAKFLRFTPKGGSRVVFAKWVRGVTPARFAKNTLDAVRPSDFAP